MSAEKIAGCEFHNNPARLEADGLAALLVIGLVRVADHAAGADKGGAFIPAVPPLRLQRLVRRCRIIKGFVFVAFIIGNRLESSVRHRDSLVRGDGGLGIHGLFCTPVKGCDGEPVFVFRLRSEARNPGTEAAF